MSRLTTACLLISFVLLGNAAAQDDSCWIIDAAEEWQQSAKESEALGFDNGLATPTGPVSRYCSVVRTYPVKRSARSIVFEQSPVWQNWNPIEDLGPSNLGDAPVLLTVGPDDYWMFGRYKAGKKRAEFLSEKASLPGFDIPLRTTPFPKQYDAPGGLKKGLGGYHAWQSRDMINWVHHGPVTEGFSRWVTTAERAKGKTYIYYDYPNDQDPHLYIDEDLFDGLPGRNMGLAFRDPSHGSDCAFIRDEKGAFHVIYEDWSPINASKRSWDSPLAGHAVSKNGIDSFEILKPAVDNRTRDTGKVAEYRHPHWKQHEDWDTNIGKYNVHEPEQEAYGDWAAICVGGQYYLFGDFDPVGGHSMSACWFTSPSLDEPFEWCGKIGKGHPDPDICFAEGRFYLATQMKTDYVSPGPWVEKVEARVGVDIDGDGALDRWTGWQEVKESYDYIEGFSKQVRRSPASIDLSGLPAGFGFSFEFRTMDTTENKSIPILDSVTITFDETR